MTFSVKHQEFEHWNITKGVYELQDTDLQDTIYVHGSRELLVNPLPMKFITWGRVPWLLKVHSQNFLVLIAKANFNSNFQLLS